MSIMSNMPQENKNQKDKIKLNKNIKDIKNIYLLPNLFTLGALFAGFYAIVAATKDMFAVAAIALFIAMLLDNLDGRIARLTNTQSTFGAELDSLSDMLAFGLAPALIVYHWHLYTLGKVGWLISFFYTATAALRLARFNAQSIAVKQNISQPNDDNDSSYNLSIGKNSKNSKKYFKGLPAPVAAAFVVGFVWNCVDLNFMPNDNNFIMSIIISFITIVASLLMVSSINYYSFKEFHLFAKKPYVGALIFLVALILIVLDASKILFLGSFLYVLSGIYMIIFKKNNTD